MKIACSTVSCPGWTLEEAVEHAAKFGYLGLEMRAFAESDAKLACNPMDHQGADVDACFDKVGIEPLGLATSVTLDEVEFPPVIGHVFTDPEAGVEQVKGFVDAAHSAGAKFVRIYLGTRMHAEPKAWGDKRIGQRITLAGQTARNTGVRVLVENAGSYARASDLLQMVEDYGNEWTGICYNLSAGMQAGDCPIEAVKLLGKRLHAIRVSDHDEQLNPAKLGDGVVPAQRVIESLTDAGSDAWIIYEYPNLWAPDFARDPGEVLAHACDTLYSWVHEPADASA